MEVISNFMFKLGEYHENRGRDIADYLKDAGMKVDIKMYTSSNLESFHFLEGRMSEIKEQLDEEEFERYAHYLDALRKVLAEGASPENFSEKYQLQLDPQINEKRRQFRELMEGSFSPEEREARREGFADSMNDLLDASNGESFAEIVLERNKINIGDYIAGRLDDPIIRIFADEDEDDESKLAKTTTVFTVEPCAAVYIDEFSALYYEDLDREFKEKYKDEYTSLLFLSKLVSELAEPSSGKIDMEAFSERCEFQLENDGNLLEINGRQAAEELARSLEKNDIIKLKGDTIKWKR